MRHRKLIALAAICALALSACGTRDTEADKQPELSAGPIGNELVDQVEPPEQGAAEPETEPDDVVDPLPLPSVKLLYYVSDSDMGELTELQLEVKDDGKGLHRRAIELLASEPGDGKVPLWKDVKFNRVELKDGVLTVDVTIPDGSRLGAPGEALALDAITRTAFQFEDVDALNILVDGEETDSLMGHESLEHPIHKS